MGGGGGGIAICILNYATLAPGRNLTAHTGEEAGWTPEPVWAQWELE
jgi:hypothetical protein